MGRGIVHDTAGSITELVRALSAADADRYLYRGQNGVFGPGGDFTRQIPSVFRGCDDASAARAALRRSRLQTAWLLDRVRSSAGGDRTEWDLSFAALHLGDLDRPQSIAAIAGIVQHYGIQTECLDLTFLEPAAAFATQRWLTIDEALALPRGAVVAVSRRGDRAFLYRYDREKLLEHGIAVGDLSSGNAGSRPILQEARTIALDAEQDRVLFESGVYEVFPFRLTNIPFVYRRPIIPSPLLNDDQRMALRAFSAAVHQGLPVAMRDLVVPPLFFAPNPFHPEQWHCYTGPSPDPMLGLGRLLERELRGVTDRNLEAHAAQAQRLFGACFERPLTEDPMNRSFVQWLRRIRRFRDRDEMPEMVEIPPGRFVMGTETAPSSMYVDETPAREVVVERGFAIGRYPVTFAQMRAFFADTRPSSEVVDLADELGADARRLPVVAVTWHEAREYCEWLSARTSHRYRLPTEVEWEYACRAGTSTSYWWGELFDPWRANSRHESLKGQVVRIPSSFAAARVDLENLTPVDRSEANPWGLHDMLGNAWEWTEDVYDDARTQLGFAPQVANEPFRALRGGSWMDPPLSLRCAARSWASPFARDRNIGFRVVREV